MDSAVDLVILLDASRTVSDANVQSQIDFIAQLAGDMLSASTATRVSVAHYTDVTTTLICLDEFTTPADLAQVSSTWWSDPGMGNLGLK